MTCWWSQKPNPSVKKLRQVWERPKYLPLLDITVPSSTLATWMGGMKGQLRRPRKDNTRTHTQTFSIRSLEIWFQCTRKNHLKPNADSQMFDNKTLFGGLALHIDFWNVIHSCCSRPIMHSELRELLWKVEIHTRRHTSFHIDCTITCLLILRSEVCIWLIDFGLMTYLRCRKIA